MPIHASDPRPIQRFDDVQLSVPAIKEFDPVVVEAPLAIANNEQVLATTMRTPGHDEELAVGWLVSESDMVDRSDLLEVRRVGASQFRQWGVIEEAVDTVVIDLANYCRMPKPRAYLTSSSCGVCSADVLESVPAPSACLHSPGWTLRPDRVHSLIDAMREQQRMFDLTGALHAAALASNTGELIVVREDVGRHNAVDKVIGHAFMAGQFPLTDHILVISGRVSYEIVAKALRACVAGIVAVSGPTTLAVDLARHHGLLLIGFARDQRINVYAGEGLLSS